MIKQKQVEEGKVNDTLAPIEQKIYDLCQSVPPGTSKCVHINLYKAELILLLSCIIEFVSLNNFSLSVRILISNSQN